MYRTYSTKYFCPQNLFCNFGSFYLLIWLDRWCPSHCLLWLNDMCLASPVSMDCEILTELKHSIKIQHSERKALRAFVHPDKSKYHPSLTLPNEQRLDKWRNDQSPVIYETRIIIYILCWHYYAIKSSWYFHEKGKKWNFSIWCIWLQFSLEMLISMWH